MQHFLRCWILHCAMWFVTFQLVDNIVKCSHLNSRLGGISVMDYHSTQDGGGGRCGRGSNTPSLTLQATGSRRKIAERCQN